MILRIILTVLLVILVSLLLYFIFSILLPAVRNQLVGESKTVFSDLDLEYIHREYREEIAVTDDRAVIQKPFLDENDSVRLKYKGIKKCSVFNYTYETLGHVVSNCIGFGDCMEFCPQNAIIKDNNRLYVTDSCCGCGKCMEVCPKKIISMVNKNDLNKSDTELQYTAPVQKGFKFWKSCYRILQSF